MSFYNNYCGGLGYGYGGLGCGYGCGYGGYGYACYLPPMLLWKILVFWLLLRNSRCLSVQDVL
ncbi:keratin-associated protein 22-1-like [Camelus ferus]|uniref:Keratin-associated protein 22-1-like n=2 Tax=Camelus TaxID=9836 RepID=A0A8B8SS16_CAMFR|nr:keratin-associated protein 22-1-like [Camelus ferus]XP_045373709.1 keratin-associated protein 22-1-like [Camelus bactrianus]